ncbi:hypothetical protein [Labilibacter marinus]|uniref:hypothetical protein n=1 Tax=Labilibacter marinus TaxID=1477105 RepID=UPI00082D7AD8|nr:hypothetical protein [Labilibacter marinus]
MKNLFKVSTAIMLMSLLITSCGKDDTNKPKKDDYTGTFNVVLDDALLHQGTTPLVGIVQDNKQEYVNTVTIADDKITISVNQFPRVIGNDVVFGTVGDPGVVFIHGGQVYTTTSGSFTRVSGSKISFAGVCKVGIGQSTHTVTGYVESKAFEVVE